MSVFIDKANSVKEIEKFSLSDIRLALEDRNLPIAGTKSELSSRLMKALEEERVRTAPSPRRSPRTGGATSKAKETTGASPSRPSKGGDGGGERAEGGGGNTTRRRSRDAEDMDTASKITQLAAQVTPASFRRNLVFMVILFGICLGAVLFSLRLLSTRASLPVEKRMVIWDAIVRDAESDVVVRVNKVVSVLQDYAQSHSFEVVMMISIVYLFYQTFNVFLFWVPALGSLLTILAGALFGHWKALLLCSTLSSLGPVFAYALYNWVGKPVALKWAGDRIRQLELRIAAHRENLFAWIFFLRVTPLFPNILINMAAPIIGVPILPLVMGTFVGLMPNTFVFVQTGCNLAKLNQLADVWWIFAGLWALGVISALPALFMKSKKVVDKTD